MSQTKAIIKGTLFLACAAIPGSTIKVRDHTVDLDTEYPWPVIPQYTVDLDLPPRQRWRHVIHAEKDTLLRKLHMFKKGFKGPEHPNSAAREAGRVVDTIVDEAHNLPDDQVEELKGIVDEACRGETSLEICGGDDPLVRLRNLIAWNLVPIILPSSHMFCTGIVATTAEGDMIQGRNLDYGDPGESMGNGLKNFLMQSVQSLFPTPLAPRVKQTKPHHFSFGLLHVTFTRGGLPLFTGVGQVGTVMFATGMRLGGFSLQEDTSTLGDTILGPDGIVSDGKPSIAHNLHALQNGATYYQSAMRTVLETASNYEEALTRLHQVRTERPHYFVLGGTERNQGAVLYKPRNGMGTVCRIGEACSFSDWMIVQTNEDPVRNTAGYSLLGQMGQQNLNPETMLRTMQTPPIFNDATRFTYIMRPARSEWILWESRNPFDANITRWSLANAHR